MLTMILDNTQYDLGQDRNKPMNKGFEDLARQPIAVDNEELAELTGAIQDDVDLSELKELFVDRPRVHPGGD